MFALRRCSSCRSIVQFQRGLITQSKSIKPKGKVAIVEVGPRDGLQNESRPLSPAVRAELTARLAKAGLRRVEAGSFVSPKWVPQMAETSTVLANLPALPGVTYPVLVPNERGLNTLLDFLNSSPSPPAVEVALFAAASDAFSRANTNCTIHESLVRLAPVAERAAQAGLVVRGYVSVVIACPYTGPVDYRVVRDVAGAMVEMGCTEISLGDTTGAGTPTSVGEMIDVVKDAVSADKLAGHFHDTFGTALANVFTALDAGVRTFDASVAGLGGCPYSPGATGNVATEDVVHALRTAGWEVPGDVSEIARTGEWVSALLGRRSESRAGRAIMARERAREKKEKAEREERESANTSS